MPRITKNNHSNILQNVGMIICEEHQMLERNNIMANDILLQVGVKVLLKNKEGKYLLLHRSAEKYPEVKGRWDIVGGRTEPGRSLFGNLKRGVREETGLELVGEPRLIAAQDILRSAGKHVVRLTYVGEARGGAVLDTNENDTYKWYSRAELSKLDDVDIYLKELLDKK